MLRVIAPEAFATRLRTALAVAVLPPAIVAVGTTAIALALAGVPNARIHHLYVLFARLCMRVGATRLLVAGDERIRPQQACVVVANHESNWDSPTVVAALPRLVIRFVAKQEIMRIPIFGHALRATGNIRVLRKQTHGDVARIQAVMERRDPDVSILFFAEGTRSSDGGLHPFKMGAFATALAHGLPVLPVGIAGTRAIWPKGLLRVRRGAAAVEVGEPIPVDGLGLEDRAALRDRTHAAVADLRARARRRLREAGCDPGGID
jgi:1-acyl-sn-glycerol-3-phosphate acyltransferase